MAIDLQTGSITATINDETADDAAIVWVADKLTKGVLPPIVGATVRSSSEAPVPASLEVTVGDAPSKLSFQVGREESDIKTSESEGPPSPGDHAKTGEQEAQADVGGT